MKVNRLQDKWTENLGGTVELEGPQGHVVAVQCPVHHDALFTIFHESVHVWQRMMVYMQEDNPGIETEAYTIEHIAKELMLQYQKVTGETLLVNKNISGNSFSRDAERVSKDQKLLDLR